MYHPPPVQFIDRQVARIEKREQPEYRCQPKPEHQHHVDCRLAPFRQRHAGVVQEHQERHGNEYLGPQWLLQKLAAFMNSELITQQRSSACYRKNRQLHIGDHRAVKFTLRLFGHQIVRAAHETKQQPDDQQVRMAHAHNVKGHYLRQELGHHVDQCCQDAKYTCSANNAMATAKNGNATHCVSYFIE
jgi:hypothetical protein